MKSVYFYLGQIIKRGGIRFLGPDLSELPTNPSGKQIFDWAAANKHSLPHLSEQSFTKRPELRELFVQLGLYNPDPRLHVKGLLEVK